MSVDLPVVLLIFNRPETTRRQLDSLRNVQPKKLFVVADGPREGHPTDAERCEQTRQTLESVDWVCDVQTNFADFNMGLGQRVSSGITWAFEHVERGRHSGRRLPCASHLLSVLRRAVGAIRR